MKRWLAILGVGAVSLAAAQAVAAAGSDIIWTDSNPHRFTLQIAGRHAMAEGRWTGEVAFTLSACPQARCFHMSGPLKIPENAGGLMEGSFSIGGKDCEIHFVEVPHRGMDSGNFRLTPIASDEAGTGCAFLPAGLAGLYRQSLPAD